MKLVGATDAFVRRPFLVEGVLQGLIAGTVASGIVWGLYRLMLRELPDLAISYAFPHAEWALAGGIVVAGVLLGWLGSFFAVRRFIKSVDIH